VLVDPVNVHSTFVKDRATVHRILRHHRLRVI
jgi:hypothetical protein